MKKNRMMRTAAILLVCVLLTTSVISGTFAKYTTSASSQDSARVATWGFDNDATIELKDLFKTAYEGDANVHGTADVIAPGTTNSASFKFTYNGSEAAPEVAYKFVVDTEGSEIATDIRNNPNIQWALYKAGTAEADIAWGAWSVLLYNIECLSGSGTGEIQYAPGQLPAAFSAADDEYVVAWRWLFETDGTEMAEQDEWDTYMGNKGTENNSLLDTVKVVIKISAEQVD